MIEDHKGDPWPTDKLGEPSQYRIKVFRVPLQYMLRVLQFNLDPDHWDVIGVEERNDIPDGAKVLAVRHNPATLCFDLVLHHPSFPPVLPWEPAPYGDKFDVLVEIWRKQKTTHHHRDWVASFVTPKGTRYTKEKPPEPSPSESKLDALHRAHRHLMDTEPDGHDGWTECPCDTAKSIREREGLGNAIGAQGRYAKHKRKEQGQ